MHRSAIADVNNLFMAKLSTCGWDKSVSGNYRKYRSNTPTLLSNLQTQETPFSRANNDDLR